MSPHELPSSDPSPSRGPWRFSLRSALVLTVHLALVFGLMKWQGAAVIAIYPTVWIAWRLWRGDERTVLRVMKFLAGYGLLSTVTLPLKDAWWVGELSLFPLLQLPKIVVANKLRRWMVMDLFDLWGWSRGSFSPDWSLARPYALALVYLVPLLLWGAILATHRSLDARAWTWLVVVLVVAAVDYTMTLAYAGGPGLSFY